MDGTNFEQWQEITNKDYGNYSLTGKERIKLLKLFMQFMIPLT